MLSIGGRLTLLKSVLGSVGSYLMSLFAVPTTVLKSLEALTARFFWCGYWGEKITLGKLVSDIGKQRRWRFRGGEFVFF